MEMNAARSHLPAVKAEREYDIDWMVASSELLPLSTAREGLRCAAFLKGTQREV
jgi:hypothetical protein